MIPIVVYDERAVMFVCVYCGKEHPSYNGTGSDVACCGEVGHVEQLPATSEVSNVE